MVGYRGQLAESIRNTFGHVLQVIISGYKKHGFRPIKGRWVIEEPLDGLIMAEDYVEITKSFS